MAMIKKKKGGDGGGANWMDTYGDMVTLLLCFFVLLFAMSTLDQQKWEMIVQSFNPDAIKTVTDVKGKDGQIVEDVENPQPESIQQAQADVDQQIEDMFEALQEYIKQQGAEESISASRGDGFVFLSLNDAVFFNGDSYILRDDGKPVLDDVGAILGKAVESIDEIRVLGHTAQASEHEKNPVFTDRALSTNRANAVITYLQEEVETFDLDPARMLSIGYGQWRPVAPNTNEERFKNRRVEFIITGKDVESDMGDSIVQYYTMSDAAQASINAIGTSGSDASTGESAPGPAPNGPTMPAATE